MLRLTIKDALKKASKELKSYKEASILLQYFLKCDEVYIILNDNLTLENYKDYEKLIKRRSENEPIEYITNSVSFYSQEFFIKKGALIPRPESELLVDAALKIIKRGFKIAEIGVGSGAISIMLAKLIKNIKITATDISKDALEIAKINAKNFNVGDKISFIKTNYLDNVNEKFDMIISNPPYIANNFVLEKNLSYEPQDALFGGVSGDEMLKDIIDIWIKTKTPYLLCEIGYDQKKSISSYFIENGIKEFSFYKDLSGLDRGFVAFKGANI